MKDGAKVKLPFLAHAMKTAFDSTRFKRDARNAARDEALAKVDELRDHAKQVQAKEGFINEGDVRGRELGADDGGGVLAPESEVHRARCEPIPDGP